MKILVPIKRVIDPYVRIRVKSDQSGVELNNVKMAMNPFDEIAVEEALRIKEQEPEKNHEVIVISIGASVSQDVLRNALAMGADKAILVSTTASYPPLVIAKTLAALIKQHAIDLVIMGKQAIDDDNNQTGQMLAALLNWPQATFASKVILDNNKAIVTREVDGGLETLRLHLPLVITTDLRLNQPRYATLPNIMKAKSKPLEVIAFESLNIIQKTAQTIVSVHPLPERKSGIILDSVDELIEKLKNVEQVIE